MGGENQNMGMPTVVWPDEFASQAAAHALVTDNFDMDKGGVKDDADKPQYDLIPPEALQYLAKVLTFGAHKYSPRNWEKGMRWGRVFAALQRHVWAWFGGEDDDPETGLSHLAHALFCVSVLAAMEVRGIGVDDRPRIRIPENPARRDVGFIETDRTVEVNAEDSRNW